MNPTKQQTQAVGWLSLGAAVSAVGAALAWRTIQPRSLPISPLDNLPVGKATAVVTGASSGIGAAFAHALAARGLNVMLVARRQERLEAISAEIQQRYGVVAYPYAADLSQASEVHALEEQLSLLDDLVLLVNNAGFGTTGMLTDVGLTPQINMLNVHVLATMRLTKAVLPGMVARGRGAIINTSSISAFFTPVEGVNYSASKAYINSFSQGLQMELKAKGVGERVRVQALCPGWTYSEFHDSAEFASFDRASIPDKLWMTAEEVVANSLDALAYDQVVVIPGRQNQLLVASARLGPIRSAIQAVRRRLRR